MSKLNKIYYSGLRSCRLCRRGGKAAGRGGLSKIELNLICVVGCEPQAAVGLQARQEKIGLSKIELNLICVVGREPQAAVGLQARQQEELD